MAVVVRLVLLRLVVRRVHLHPEVHKGKRVRLLQAVVGVLVVEELEDYLLRLHPGPTVSHSGPRTADSVGTACQLPDSMLPKLQADVNHRVIRLERRPTPRAQASPA